jgi:hypothetical protein
MNISLLCKWWWKLEKEDGLWQQIIRHKYLQNNSVHDVEHKINDSPMWTDLLKVKHIYLQGRGILIKDGAQTRFWLDPWLDSEPLALHAPVLFALCENKNISVAHALQDTPIIFRRWLHVELRTSWEEIWERAKRFQLVDTSDEVMWKLGTLKKFSVKSVYNGLTKNEIGVYHKRIWKGRIPPKIKIFLWLMSCGALLTRDNMRRRNWQGDPSCVFL